eukprot:675832_1
MGICSAKDDSDEALLPKNTEDKAPEKKDVEEQDVPTQVNEPKNEDIKQQTDASDKPKSDKENENVSADNAPEIQENENKNDNLIGPTQLHRPVIVCCDIESNAWGDRMYQIPPLSYTYLTMRSRTTQNNPLYSHSMGKLRNDPSTKLDRHSWFLQSAYALGFQAEPELTSFNRYWPHEITAQDDFANNIT